jgi:hypothetical protein
MLVGEIAMTDKEREALTIAVRHAIHTTAMPASMTVGERIEARRLMKVAAGEAVRTFEMPA